MLRRERRRTTPIAVQCSHFCEPSAPLEAYVDATLLVLHSTSRGHPHRTPLGESANDDASAPAGAASPMRPWHGWTLPAWRAQHTSYYTLGASGDHTLKHELGANTDKAREVRSANELAQESTPTQPMLEPMLGQCLALTLVGSCSAYHGRPGQCVASRVGKVPCVSRQVPGPLGVNQTVCLLPRVAPARGWCPAMEGVHLFPNGAT
jgi:hypothetical protein